MNLSPFEVVEDNIGYYSTNTTAGTRLNSKIEDLGASISVVTKEQMADFALLDVNDIFNYEASTEGTGNYTSYSVDVNGSPVDGVKTDPIGANRIRGLSAANTTFGNFETSGRVPIDPLNIDAVEISRGPNSSIFGIGSSSGTVNSVPSSANLTRNKSQWTGRGDSSGGYRTTLDVNRVLKRGVLAVRGSAAYQFDGFEQKPSGIESVRLNGMIKAQPFKSTLLTGSFSTYRMHGVRPNAIMPRDAITGWQQSGSPTWDPVARTVKVNGVVIGTFAAVPTQYFEQNAATIRTSNIAVDQQGLTYWGIGQSTLSIDPGTASGTGKLMTARADPTGFLAAQPLFGEKPVLTNRNLYDWTSINLNANNRTSDDSVMASVLLDQMFLNTQHQTLALQLGWFRETNDRSSMSGNTLARAGSVIEVDVNERRLDGSPNPNFLRPFIAVGSPSTMTGGVDRDTYRAQLLYQLDFRQEKNWLRWLGQHQLSGYAEYKDYATRTRLNYHAIVDNHSWIAAGLPHLSGANGGLPAGPFITQGQYNFYLGDNRGYDVQYGPGPSPFGKYVMEYGNPTTGFVREPAEIGTVVGSNTGNRIILKSEGAVLQSHLAKDRLVTTLGWRRDTRYTRNLKPLRLFADGVHLDPISDEWADGDWSIGEGDTKTVGAVLKPTHWLSVYMNTSSSFQPASPAQDSYFRFLPDPTGKGKDYGVMLSLFSGKLFIRVNHYTTNQDNIRTGIAATAAGRMAGYDFSWRGGAGNAFRLQPLAEGWATAEAKAKGVVLTQSQLNARVAELMHVPVEFLVQPITGNSVTSTDQNISKGNEIEINYNPNNYWTVKMNVVEQQAIGGKVAASFVQWVEERTAAWQTIIDPTTGRPWYTERYGGASSAAELMLANVLTPLDIARAQEGKRKPQTRRYRTNFSTSYKLAGLTDQRVLKAVNIGGALRWEDKAAIGYYGAQKLPAIITKLDPSRPIYDKSNLNVDLFVSYRTRLFANKVAATWQLNVRNVNESGRLQPIAANPDGTASAYRIVDPRKFILSVTFNL